MWRIRAMIHVSKRKLHTHILIYIIFFVFEELIYIISILYKKKKLESIENHLQLSWFGRTAASNSHFTDKIFF